MSRRSRKSELRESGGVESSVIPGEVEVFRPESLPPWLTIRPVLDGPEGDPLLMVSFHLLFMGGVCCFSPFGPATLLSAGASLLGLGLPMIVFSIATGEARYARRRSVWAGSRALPEG